MGRTVIIGILMVLLIGNWTIKRKIRFEREHKGVENHG